MISAREISSSIYGAWRLVRMDSGAMQYFDTSIEGFWRSFFAAVIVAPAQIALAILRPEEAVQVDGLRYTIVVAIAYVVEWTAWPLVMFHIAKPLQREAAYPGYIVAYNWSQVIGAGFLLALMLIGRLLLPSDDLGGLIFVGIMMLLAYQWIVARIALNISAGFAAILVIVNIALTMLIGITAQNLLAVGSSE